MKKTVLIIFLLCSFVASLYAQNETLTILTYYPAPYGIYQNLKVTQQEWIGTDAGGNPLSGGRPLLQVGGTTNTNGAIYGLTTSGTNDAFGVYGATYGSALTYGVVGTNSSNTSGSAGVKGSSETQNGQVYGVYGTTISNTNSACGVKGEALGSAGQIFGVYGITSSNDVNAAGVRAESTSAMGIRSNGATYGGYFTGTTGLKGVSDSQNGTGVVGENTSSNSPAVGVSATSTNGYGIRATGGRYSGYFNGGTVASVGLSCSGTINNTQSGDGGLLLEHSNYANKNWKITRTEDNLYFFYINGAATNARMILRANGDLVLDGGIYAVLPNITDGTTGNYDMDYDQSLNRIGYDIAELFDANDEVGPGDVLSIDENGKLKKCDKPNDTTVAGIVSDAPAIIFEGSSLQVAPKPFEFKKGNKPPLAIAGRVFTNVTTENGPIKPGDLLTTSSTPGYAMKAVPKEGESACPQGCILGKALEELKEGKGKILVLVSLM